MIIFCIILYFLNNLPGLEELMNIVRNKSFLQFYNKLSCIWNVLATAFTLSYFDFHIKLLKHCFHFYSLLHFLKAIGGIYVEQFGCRLILLWIIDLGLSLGCFHLHPINFILFRFFNLQKYRTQNAGIRWHTDQFINIHLQ